MIQSNDENTTFRNLKVVISDEDMQQVKKYCQSNGYKLGAWAGKVLMQSIHSTQEGQHA